MSWRVGIDGKYLGVRPAGVHRYAWEVVTRLVARRPENYVLLAPPWAGSVRWRNASSSLGLRAVAAFWEQVVLPFRARGGGLEVIYCPGSAMPLVSARAIIVIHDVIALRHPEWFSRSFAWWARTALPRAARRAVRLITDSEASRADLIELFPFVEDKLHVVYPGIGDHFRPAPEAEQARVRAQYGLSRPFLICVGTLDPRKNITTVLRAWRAAAAATTDAELVVVGMTSSVFSRSRAIAGELVDGARVRWLGYVADEDLPGLYSASRGLVFPSLYEGFGFPPLEAMACGRAAIVSSRGSLREVCGPAGRYVDPQDVTQIADLMAVALREGLDANGGRRQAARFTWDATVAATERVIADVGS